MKRIMVFFIVLTLLLSMVLAGCGKKQDKADDVATRFAAYQFAKAEVQRRLPVPNSAVFPHITESSLEVAELEEGKKIEFKGKVAHRNPVNNETIANSFVITVVHEGQDQWRTESISIE